MNRSPSTPGSRSVRPVAVSAAGICAGDGGITECQCVVFGRVVAAIALLFTCTSISGGTYPVRKTLGPG